MIGSPGRTHLSGLFLVFVALSTIFGSVAAADPAVADGSVSTPQLGSAVPGAGSSDPTELIACMASPPSEPRSSTRGVGGDGTVIPWNGGRSLASLSTSTFDFESGVSGAGYGDGDVSQTVDGVTVTLSAGGTDTTRENHGGHPRSMGGMYAGISDHFGNSATITFDKPVDVDAISLGDYYGMHPDTTWTLTPDGGNSPTTVEVYYFDGKQVTDLSWTGVTRIDISTDFDVLLMIDDIEFTESVTNAEPSFGGGDSASLTVDEDAGATDITGLLTAHDSDDDDLTWSVDSAPSHGSLGGFPDTQAGPTSGGVDPSGLTYAPEAGYAGSDSFDVNVSDGTGGTDTITVNVDVRDAPEVSSIDRVGSSPTNASSVDFDVTFSESVSHVDTSDVTVTTVSGDAAGSVGSVDGSSGTAIRVTVGSITGDGDFRLDLTDDDSITNANGVPLGGVGTSGAGDGSFTGGETVAIDTTDPTFGSGTDPSFAENGAGTVLDVQADDDAGSDYDTDVTYSLVGGADRSAFGIDADTGALTFDSSPDFEAPTDADADNDYAVEVRATDDAGNSATDTVTAAVTDVDESPTFSSGSSVHVDDTAPNGTSVIDVNATVGGGADQGVSYAITDGNVGSAFDIEFGTGVITVADDGEVDGTSEFVLTIEASEGTRSTTQTLTVTVDDTTAPTADAGGDRTVDEDSTVSFDGSESSDVVGITSYEWDFGDGSKNATGLTPTHTYGDPGTYTVTLRVADAAGNEASDTVTVLVTDVTAPAAEAGSDQTVDEDTPVAFDGSGSTDNDGIAAYEWDFGDGSANATGVAPTHAFSDPGAYSVTLRVTDAAGNSDTDTLTATVEDVTAPTADAGSDRTVDEDTSISFAGSASADNVGITGYEWAFGDGSANVTGVTPSHTYTEPGTYTVTMAATDAAGNTASDTLTVTVSDTTSPAAAAGSDRAVDEDSTVNFDGSNSSDNVGITGYEWAFGDGSTNVTGATASHTYTEPGTYTVTVTATDAAGNSDADALTVTVEDVTAPTANAGLDRTTDEDATVSFDGTGSTDNVGVDSYAWDFGDGSKNGTGAAPSHTYAEPGSYTVTVTVTDAVGNEDADTLTVTVEDATAPTADAGENQTVEEDTVVNFDASSSTDNVGIASYEWSFGDGSKNGTGTTSTHTYVEPGTYTVALTVTDAAGNARSDAAAVTVEDVTTPTADAGSNRSVEEDSTVNFDGSNSTDNAGITSYEWDFGDGSKNVTGVTATHAYGEPGMYTASLTVTDPAGNTDTDTLTVIVTDTTAPMADVGPNRTVDEGIVVRFDGSNSTDNAGITAYEWDLGDGSNASGVSPTHTYAEPGTYTVTLNVTDGAANADADTAVVTVRDVTAPVADAGPDRTVENREWVRFDGSNSTDNVGIAAYNWTFGDDSTAAGATAGHRYRETGTYTVVLRATDAAGNAHNDSLVVTVERRRGGGGGGGSSDGDGADSDGIADSTDGDTDGTYRVGVSRSAAEPNRSAIRVENAAAGSTVNVTSDAAERMDSDDERVNISVTNLEVSVVRGGSFDLDVTTDERHDAEFDDATGSVSVGRVTVDHTIPDEDIDAVQFTFRIRAAYLDRAGVDPDQVTLYRLHDGEHRALETSVVRVVGGRYVFRADSPGFSVFTIGVSPAATAVDTASVDAERLSLGDPVTVSAVVQNDGGMRGEYPVDVSVDGEVVATRTVTVDPGETVTVEHTLELAAGSHVLAANGVEAGTVVVEQNEPVATEPPQVTAEPSGPGAGLPWVWLLLALLVGLSITGVAFRRRRE